MKRPLVVLSVGFVLGEVLALENFEVVFPSYLGWLLAVLGAAGVLVFGIHRWNPAGKGPGRGAGKKALLLFLALAVSSGAAGFGRGAWERQRLDREETAAGEFSGIKPLVRGRIEKVEQGNGSVSLVLSDVTARAGNRQEKFGRVSVYMEVEDGKGSGDRTGREKGGEYRPGMEKGGGGKPGKEKDGGYRPGMVVELRGKLEAVEGPGNPGEFDFRSYHRSKGIVCRMFGTSLEVKEAHSVPFPTFLMEFRAKCARILDGICVPGDSAIFKAVLLGDTSGLEKDVRSMYQRHGISHLLAVSGQHLAIIGGSVYLLMRRLGLGFGKAGALSGVLVVSYGLMAGSPGSVMRAIIMILCLWLAAREGRSYDTLSALGLGAVILLWKSPYLLFQSGFQLSFGAVWSIGGLGSWLIHELEVENKWQKTLLISLCVQIVITPVVLFHYFQHPLYGIFLNLLVIPLMPVLMYSGLLGIMAGSLWLKGGVAAVGAGHYVICIYGWLCRQVERLPGHCLVMGRPSWFWIGMYAAGMGAGLWGLVKWKRWMRGRMGRGLGGRKWKILKERGGGVKKIRGVEGDREAKGGRGVERVRGVEGDREVEGVREVKRVREAEGVREGNRGTGKKRGLGMSWFSLGVAACIYGICFLLLFPRPVNGLEVLVMDVGQGDGILMRTGRYTVLIDGGSSSDKSLGEKRLEPCLKSMGITAIDFALVSHGDSDHISGLLYLMEESQDIKVRNLFLPARGKGQEVYDGLEQAARLSGGEVRYMEPGEQIQAGNLELTCLYGGGRSFPAQDRNAHSLVVCGDYKGFHMLFTGDMGMEQEEELLKLARREGSLQQEHLDHVQVLKTAHHGSETSSGGDFLDRMGLKLGVISYGKGNTYGHPSPQVVERMKNRRIPVMETGTGGAVMLWTDGKELSCRYFKRLGGTGIAP